MTRGEAKQLLPIIEAYANGETIQILTSLKWEDLKDAISFNYPVSHYRIKPKPLEYWALVDRDSNVILHIHPDADVLKLLKPYNREDLKLIKLKEVPNESEQ
jgi:hypothetical protein